ncbi:MAG: hypothetical protein ACT4O1_08385 [Gemmatimonadota bacterium]
MAPTDHGIITSLEVYAANGDQILLMVSKRQDGREESDYWRALLESLEVD